MTSALSSWFASRRARRTRASRPSTLGPLPPARTADERRLASLNRQASASTAAAARVAESTVEVAAATLAELETQTESLDRVARALDRTAEDVRRSEKTLADINACCLPNPFAARRRARRERAERAERPERPAAITSITSNGGAPATAERAKPPELELSLAGVALDHSGRPPTRTAANASSNARAHSSAVDMSSHAADEHDSDIDAVSRALDVLKDAGGRMGEELAKQCERVDEIASSADAVGARVDRAAATGALGRERRRAEAKKRTPR